MTRKVGIAIIAILKAHFAIKSITASKQSHGNMSLKNQYPSIKNSTTIKTNITVPPYLYIFIPPVIVVLATLSPDCV